MPSGSAAGTNGGFGQYGRVIAQGPEAVWPPRGVQRGPGPGVPHGCPGVDPVVNAPAGVGGPPGRIGTQLDAARGGVVPQQSTAARGVPKGNGDHGIALNEVDHPAFLVQTSVQMLPETVQPLTVLRLEALLTARGGVQEPHPTVRRGLHGEASVDQAGRAVVRHRQVGVRGGRGAVQRAGLGGVDGPRRGPDPDRVRSPVLDARISSAVCRSRPPARMMQGMATRLFFSRARERASVRASWLGGRYRLGRSTAPATPGQCFLS